MTDITLEQRAAHVATLGEMFQQCANERRMIEADALAAAIAALRLSAGADWVIVEDRLPGPAEHVEVWPDPRDDTYTFYAHCDGGTNGVKAGRWYYTDREGYCREIRVTHWRKSTPGPEAAAPRHEPGEG